MSGSTHLPPDALAATAPLRTMERIHALNQPFSICFLLSLARSIGDGFIFIVVAECEARATDVDEIGLHKAIH